MKQMKHKPSWLSALVNEKPDRLRLLKSRYLVQITKMETGLKNLRDKLRLIDELESDAEGLSPNPSTNGGLKYAGWQRGLTEAALAAVNSIALSDPVPGGKIAKHLLEHGYVPNGKNFGVALNTTLKRLAKNLRINSEKVDGTRRYWAGEYR